MIHFAVGLLVGAVVGVFVPSVASWIKAKFTRPVVAVEGAVSTVESDVKKL
jgi:hypothetical protein